MGRNNKKSKKGVKNKAVKSAKEGLIKKIITGLIISVGSAVVLTYFIHPTISKMIVNHNRYEYFNALNTQVTKTINFNADNKFKRTLEKANKDEYRDIHDYFSGLAKALSGDNKGANYSFSSIPHNKSLYPAAIYSRIQCGFTDSKNDSDKKILLSALLKELEDNGRENELEGYLVKTLLRRVDLDVSNALKDAIAFNNNEKFKQVLTIGKEEFFLLEDLAVIHTIRAALFATIIYVSSENENLASIRIEGIDLSFDDWVAGNIKELLIHLQCGEYFGVGNVVMPLDKYFLPETLEILNNSGYHCSIIDVDKVDKLEYNLSDFNGVLDGLNNRHKRKFK